MTVHPLNVALAIQAINQAKEELLHPLLGYSPTQYYEALETLARLTMIVRSNPSVEAMNEYQRFVASFEEKWGNITCPWRQEVQPKPKRKQLPKPAIKKEINHCIDCLKPLPEDHNDLNGTPKSPICDKCHEDRKRTGITVEA